MRVKRVRGYEYRRSVDILMTSLGLREHPLTPTIAEELAIAWDRRGADREWFEFKHFVLEHPLAERAAAALMFVRSRFPNG